MSRRIYDNGVLIEEWDDVTRTYRRWSSSGVLLESRAYTSAEIAAIVGMGRVVLDDREVVMYDDDGTAMFKLGKQSFGDWGFTLAREDGSTALRVNRAFADTTQQEVRIFDRLGYQLVGEEALGSGLARPLLHIPMQPVTAASTTLQHGPYGVEVPIATGTWTTTHQAWYARHNQYAEVVAQIAASDATTAAEVRVINSATSDVLGAFLAGGWTGTRAAGSTGFASVTSPALFLPGIPDSRISIAVQVRRTAGTGTLRVALPESHGA